LLRRHCESAKIVSMSYWKLMIMDISPMRSQGFVLRFIAEKECTACSRTNNNIDVEISSVKGTP
jgi:hypothetical protein